MFYQENVNRRFEGIIFDVVREIRNPQRFLYPISHSAKQFTAGVLPFHLL